MESIINKIFHQICEKQRIKRQPVVCVNGCLLIQIDFFFRSNKQFLNMMKKCNF